jgi:hypothetical protein
MDILNVTEQIINVNANEDVIDINVVEEVININVDDATINILSQPGAYPLPSTLFSVFGRVGNVVAQEGDYNLDQLSGVTISSPSNGQILRYNGTNWVNVTPLTGGSVTSVDMSVPLGLQVSGNPIVTSGTLAVSLASGYVIPTQAALDAKQDDLNGTGIVKSTAGTISYLTDNTANWDAAYNDKINSASVTGTTTKTLTLNQQDGGTITASWTDDNTDAVSSVFGRTGAVVAANGDYNTSQVTENINLYYTDARSRNAISETITGIDYNNTSGVFSMASGYAISTTASQATWDAAYNDKINSASVTGTTTKTLTLNQQDGGTITASWSDIDTGLTSVGLSMPAAFSVSGSPLTSNGVISVTAAGLASQYVRGDGALADFPTSTGGGSSVSYYLNSSVSQGTIGGVAYRELSKEPIIGAGTDITISANGYVASYITDANDPSLLEVPGGNFNCEFYFSVNSNNHNPFVYAELYKYNGTTFTLLGSSQAIPEYLTSGTNLHPYYFAIPVATAALNLTDRIALRIYVNVDTRVVTLHTENSHLCQVVTTFSKGMTSLNNITKQIQYLATGTSGSDFNISSATDTHTFNLPIASGTNTGKLSSTDWSTFNNKQPLITAGTTAQYYRGDKTFQTLDTLAVPENTNLYYTEARVSANTDVAANTAARHNAVTIGTANGLSLSTQALSLAAASTSTTGALTSTDWNTFNGKQAALNGTGFVKISGTTISYDNSTYLTTSSAASTYLPLIGGTLTGALNGTSANFSSTLRVDMGTSTTTSLILTGGLSNFQIQHIASDTNTYIHNSSSGGFNFTNLSGNVLSLNGLGAAIFSSSVTASSLIKSGGTSSQFLKADGSVDSTSYQGSLTLTTTGTSGAATLIGNTLNIPQYSGGGGSISLSAIGSTPNANAATLTGSVLNLEPASASFGGVVTTGTQTFAGAKTVTSLFTISGITGNFLQSNQNSTNAQFQTWYASNGTTRRGYFGYPSGNNNFQLLNEANGSLGIGTNNAINLTIATTGNANFSNSVGVGTSTIGSNLQVNGNAAIGYSASTAAPTNGLAVSGNIQLTGDSYVYGNATAGGTTLRAGIRFNSTSQELKFFTSDLGRFVITSGGNVGIGVDAPSIKLQVSNAANGNIASFTNTVDADLSINLTSGVTLLTPSTGTLAFGTSSTERMRINSGGNLGLGVTPSSWWSSLRAIELYGGSIFTYASSNSDFLYINSNLYYNGTNYIYSKTGFATQYAQVSGSHSWFSAASGTAGTSLSLTAYMQLNASGNLGLNTTTIGSRLQVNGNAAIGYSASTAAPTNGLAVSGNFLVGYTSSFGTAAFNVSSAAPASSGNFVNGVTIANTTGGRGVNIGINDGGAYNYIQSAYVNNAGVSTALAFFIGSSQRMLITSSGNVSIGNSNNTYKLDVSASSIIRGTLAIDNNGQDASPTEYIRFERTSQGSANYFNSIYSSTGSANNYMQFRLSGTGGSQSTIMTLDGTGVVGIGTTTIGSKLQVNGNAAIGYSASTAAPTNGLKVAGEITTETSISVTNIEAGVYANYFGPYSGGSTSLTIVYNSTGSVLWSNGGIKMTLASNGDLSLSRLAGTGSRTVLADSSGVLSAPISDISVKQNISTIGYGLKEINKMNPVWFDFIDEYKNYGEGRQNGAIAQEMAEIIPEAVFTTPSTGKMGINYDQLHAVYIKAIQELEARIKQLENKN